MNGTANALASFDLGALFAPLAACSGILLAVSGGPDSTALLLMATAWARQVGAPPLHAATVEHGLRAASAREAADVAALCGDLGVSHATLPWLGEKPKTRLQERAREARYRLLVEEAKRVGADAIVTAHHLDDQAETVLFRLARGSGIAGLAGMAAWSSRDGVALVRPLLALPKSALIAVCEAAGVSYARDPSNKDVHYARPRLRLAMEAFAREGLDARGLARLARRAAVVEEALSVAEAKAEARLHLIEALACDGDALLEEPDEIVRRLLTKAVARLTGRDIARIGQEKMEALLQALRRARDTKPRFSANVAGARVKRERDGRLLIEPEPKRRSAAR